MKRRRLGLRIVATVTFLAITLLIFLAFKSKLNLESADETQAFQAKWAAYGISDYSITVVQGWLPLTRYDRIVIVREGFAVAQERDPDCPSSANWCDKPLESPGQYTVDALFSSARQCIEETKAIYMRCKPGAVEFQGFSSFEEMNRIGKACHEALGSSFLCKVEFDQKYGYPKSITWLNPNLSDGIGGFEITKFQIDVPK